jgi:hypothetical protein
MCICCEGEYYGNCNNEITQTMAIVIVVIIVIVTIWIRHKLKE